MRSLKIAVIAALMSVMGAHTASAGLLSTFLRSGPQGSPIINTIEDNDAEYVKKGAGNTDTTKFEVGDSVVLYLDFATITSSDGFFLGTPLNASVPAAGGPGYTLLGKGEFVVTSIVPTVGGNGDFSFTGAVELVENTIGLTYNFTAGIAATDAVFTSASNSAVLKFGTAAGSDDFITALGAPISFASIPTSGTAVDADFGLSVLGPNNLGIVEEALPGSSGGAATGTFHDIVGSTQTFSILNPGNTIGDDKFDLRTNTEFSLASQVPEPASVTVFACIAACGFGAHRRRRRNAS